MSNNTIETAFDKIRKDLRRFIDLSLREDDAGWGKWISAVGRQVAVRCWEEKECGQEHCPAYRNPCGRCWIIAGTMCGGEPQGKFARKFSSCRECSVYQKIVFESPAREIEEHLIVLVHSLRCRQQEVQELTIVDHLTGLYNRRHFDAYLSHEAEKVLRSRSTLTVMIADVNDFKMINDRFGHARGDEVLRSCAAIIGETVRKADMAFRYGGDEFAIVLHECCDNASYAEALISRIDHKLELWTRLHGGEIPLTLSYGYGILSREHAELERVIRAADENMYRDKQRRKEEGAVKRHPS